MNEEGCKHLRIQTWIGHHTGKVAGLWSCAECGHKFVPLDIAQETDAARWRWLVRHASLGFDGAPSWDAIVRMPVFDADDTTIAALVDRAMERAP